MTMVQNHHFIHLMELLWIKKGILYVADCNNNAIRKISTDGKVQTLVRDKKEIQYPQKLTLDGDGNLLVSNAHSNCIAKVKMDGSFEIVAGSQIKGHRDGSAEKAEFNQPAGILWKNGVIYVCDSDNNCIRRIKDGQVYTIAGNPTRHGGNQDGKGKDAYFYLPMDICLGHDGFLYIADVANRQIRRMSEDGTVVTQKYKMSEEFNRPNGLITDHQGNLIVADAGSNKIKIISTDGVIDILAGSGQKNSQNGSAEIASFSEPRGLALGYNGIYVTELHNHTIRKIILNLIWTPKDHHQFDRITRHIIKSVMILNLNNPTTQNARHPECYFYRVPKDVLFIIFRFLPIN